MIFTEIHAQQMLDRSKWQTRRPVKPGEYAIVATIKGPTEHRFRWHPEIEPLPQKGAEIIEVRDAKGRLKWKVGKDYAAQTGRGKRAIGRTPPIEAIRRERLWDISTADCFGEGIYPTYNYWMHPAYSYAGCEADFRTPQEAFRNLWNSIYHKDSNVEVWALKFERNL